MNMKVYSFNGKYIDFFLFLSGIAWSVAWCPSSLYQYYLPHSRCIILHASGAHSAYGERLMQQSENRMLPHQRYNGVLNYEGYRHWLRLPHDFNATFSSITSNERHFTSTGAKRREQAAIQPPHIEPKHLQPIYVDDHIIVLNKPSGILSVPGPRRHECASSLAYRYFGKGHHDSGAYNTSMEENIVMQPLNEEDCKQLDTMIVHRLDRDTSGVLLLARNDMALKRLPPMTNGILDASLHKLGAYLSELLFIVYYLLSKI